MPPPNDTAAGDRTVHNFALLRDLLTSSLFPTAPAAELADLTETLHYLAETLFSSLPPPLRTLTPATSTTPPPSPSSLPPLPPETLETLTTYSLHPHPESLLESVLEQYITSATAPEPAPKPVYITECEICEREVPLTFHHLIPRSTHKFVVKRGWHAKEELGRGAWLCRPCHSFVHKIMGNRELAREGDTVEKLLEREDVGRWRGWVGRVRWGERRG